MGVPVATGQLVSNYFKYLQRNQVNHVKETVKQLKLNDPTFTPVNTLKLSGDSSLHICARLGHLELVKYLIEEEGAHQELQNLDGKTALHDAAQFSHLPVVDYLLGKGSNVNVVKKADWTPLMLACTKDNLEVVQSLVKAGADLNFINKDGWTCIHIAAREGHLPILEFLLNSVPYPDQRKLLKEKKSRNGRRAIHTAVLHGHLNVVKLLAQDTPIEELNAEDNCGSSPLFDAVRSGYINILEYFLDHLKINVNMTNRNGVGLLHVAAETNQAEILKILVNRYGLDVNVKSDLLGFTPLQWATREGNQEAIQALMELSG